MAALKELAERSDEGSTAAVLNLIFNKRLRILGGLVSVINVVGQTNQYSTIELVVGILTKVCLTL